MQKICGSFYADWRDENGIRHRKTFPTKKEAVKFQQQQQGQARKNRQARAAR
jgi:hypothetical protein